jgi:endonuclease/exonuclease/phosphatase family metal-dependent hydrolase
VSTEPRLEAVLFTLAGLFLVLAQDLRGVLPGFEPGPRDGRELRLLTWNVGGARRGRPHGFVEAHRERVVDALRASDADLVFLQELGDFELLDGLVGLLGPEWSALRGPGGCALLTPHGPLERFRVSPARALGAHLRFDELVIAAVCIHAHAFASRERNQEIGHSLDDLMEEEADLHVFAGDLNIDLDLDKRGDLFSDDLHADVETYNYVAQRLLDAARNSGPTAEPDRRLDYVFVTPSVIVRKAGPWKGQRTGTMDHDPLVVDVTPRVGN